MLQDAAVDGETSSPSQAVVSRGSDVTSSPAQWRANLRKTSSISGGGVDSSSTERSDADQLSRSSSLSAKTTVCLPSPLPLYT